ncbi:MAG: hypothetical protein LUC91_10620 [Prevotella sp.]|nr:hypothetical protein [Prevotella sp.]
MSALLLTMSVNAQTVEDKPTVEGTASESLSAIRLASDLLRYGYNNKSTLALVDALQIFSENPTQNLNATREGSVVDTSESEGKSAEVAYDYETVLADAKKFAEGDANLLAIIDNIDAEAKGSQRGAVNGPSLHYDSVNGNSTDTYSISFVAGYLAEILVSGDGDTDLDLYVYDSGGHLIAKDDDYSDDCYVCWVPAWTGRFIVKIVNRGRVYNRYAIATN